MIVVVDAGVFVMWYVDEPHSAEAEILIDDRFEIHAPQLMLSEFGNILWKKCRKEDLDESVAVSAVESIQTRGIIFSSDSVLLKPALIGAMETGQTVYDWAYLTLAIALDCRFVTADRKFFQAMRNTRFKKYMTWVENIAAH